MGEQAVEHPIALQAETPRPASGLRPDPEVEHLGSVRSACLPAEHHRTLEPSLQIKPTFTLTKMPSKKPNISPPVCGVRSGAFSKNGSEPEHERTEGPSAGPTWRIASSGYRHRIATPKPSTPKSPTSPPNCAGWPVRPSACTEARIAGVLDDTARAQHDRRPLQDCRGENRPG